MIFPKCKFSQISRICLQLGKFYFALQHIVHHCDIIRIKLKHNTFILFFYRQSNCWIPGSHFQFIMCVVIHMKLCKLYVSLMWDFSVVGIVNFKIRKISAKAKGSPFGKVCIWGNKPLYSSYIRKEIPQSTTGKSSSHSQKPFNRREPQTQLYMTILVVPV